MARKPSIPHRIIVDFILSGQTTQDAKDHFGFKNDNVANLRVYAAFKALGLPRPRYAEARRCEFCGQQFVARDFKQRTCGSAICQSTLIAEWQRNNPEAAQRALQKYRRTEKWRQNNIRMHRRKRERGKSGSAQDKWNFSATEIKKSLRKLSYLAFRGSWEYRLQHVQKVAQAERGVAPRNARTISAETPAGMWQEALRAVQTMLLQYRNTAMSSQWERSVNRISGALRMGVKVREWKRRQQRKQSHLTT
jgi:hypothetical protein